MEPNYQCAELFLAVETFRSDKDWTAGWSCNRRSFQCTRKK